MKAAARSVGAPTRANAESDPLRDRVSVELAAEGGLRGLARQNEADVREADCADKRSRFDQRPLAARRREARRGENDALVRRRAPALADFRDAGDGSPLQGRSAQDQRRAGRS